MSLVHRDRVELRTNEADGNLKRVGSHRGPLPKGVDRVLTHYRNSDGSVDQIQINTTTIVVVTLMHNY